MPQNPNLSSQWQTDLGEKWKEIQQKYIQDPRGLCRDITNIGKWGNGDVEVNLDNFNDLSYVMGLIRQSFDYQIAGN